MRKKKEDLRVYVLMLSKEFPKDHPKVGQDTYFDIALKMALGGYKEWQVDTPNGTVFLNVPKLHTIRKNYDRWEKRIKAVQEGKAVLSIRQWRGRPYEKGNTQIEIARLGKDDGIGIQKLNVQEYTDADDGIERAVYCIDGKPMPMLTLKQMAENDGLTVEDWKAWFKDIDLTEPLPIIHFTKFRYGKQE